MSWQSTLPAHSTPPELYTPTAMAEVDRRAVAAGKSIAVLMQRAGAEVANLIASLHVHGTRIVCLAGPGNNGGDAYVAAKVLADRGYDVSVAALDMPPSAERAAQDARRQCSARLLPPDEAMGAIQRADVVVDGLFGGGLARPLSGPAEALVQAANDAAATRYAIDIASGVNGATGAVEGTAFKAHRTITFERAKLGHALMPGRRYTGQVSVCEIGMPPRALAAVPSAALLNGPAAWSRGLPRLADADHKYGRGHLFVVSGPMASTGAARLAAMAGLRAGAGLVTLASPPDAVMVNACHSTTVMVRRVDGAEALTECLAERRAGLAVVIGPGLPVDENGLALLEAALQSPAHVVIDAGAVRCFGLAPDRILPVLEERNARGTPAVWTPHSGEVRTLTEALSVSGPKVDRVAALAQRLGVVLEKGADTVIASGEGRIAVNANAPPWLATAGTGDVLAGTIGGLLAQGFPAFDAAAAGVWLHGEAACVAGMAMIADDLVGAIKPARVALDSALLT